MATIKSYTDIEQSRKLADILPIESADMHSEAVDDEGDMVFIVVDGLGDKTKRNYGSPVWSLAALLNILHSKQGNIPSLSGGGYKDGKYISDWCLDYEFENGDYQKTFADNPVDACVAMIIKLSELNLL